MGEKERIADMTEEERKVGLDKAVKGFVGCILRIAASLVVMWIIWRAYF